MTEWTFNEEKAALNIKKIRAQIAPYRPAAVAVTKYFGAGEIIKYYEAGFRDFGENRVKDALEKMEKLPADVLKNSRFHLIGHLQTNKAKLACGNFYLIQSVDSVKLADALNEAAEHKGIIQKILLQINNAKEEQKSGFYPEEIKKACAEIIKMPNLKIEGVMNMAPLNSSDEELHYLFRNIKQINDELQSEFKLELKQISMGMSRDYMIALEEGASMIRLGRILFE